MSSEERIQILKMIENGKISAEEGMKLMEAVDSGQSSDEGAGAAVATRPRKKKFRIQVFEGDMNKPKVNVNIPENAGSSKINLYGNVGKVLVVIPPEVAAKVSTNGCLGSVKMPNHFKQLGKKRSFIALRGKWETENFDGAANQVIIRAQGGVGSLKVMTPQPESVEA